MKVVLEFRLGLWSDAMTLPQPMPFFSAAANFAAGNDTPRAFLTLGSTLAGCKF